MMYINIVFVCKRKMFFDTHEENFLFIVLCYGVTETYGADFIFERTKIRTI